MEEMDRLANLPNHIVISCHLNLNIDYLKKVVWDCLGLIRVYTKRRQEMPDLDEAIILKNGSTIRELCASIHNSIVSSFKNALVWGTSCKFSPQNVGLNHLLHNEDVVQINLENDR